MSWQLGLYIQYTFSGKGILYFLYADHILSHCLTLFYIYPFLWMTPFILYANCILSLQRTSCPCSLRMVSFLCIWVLSAGAILSLQVTTFLWWRHPFFADNSLSLKMAFLYQGIAMLLVVQYHFSACVILSLPTGVHSLSMTSFLCGWQPFFVDDILSPRHPSIASLLFGWPLTTLS